jgi:hypothetical protein
VKIGQAGRQAVRVYLKSAFKAPYNLSFVNLSIWGNCELRETSKAWKVQDIPLRHAWHRSSITNLKFLLKIIKLKVTGGKGIARVHYITQLMPVVLKQCAATFAEGGARLRVEM